MQKTSKENESPNQTKRKPHNDLRVKSVVGIHTEDKPTKNKKLGNKISTESCITEEINERPSPSNFEEFLPWACNAYSLSNLIIFTAVAQDVYISSLKKRKSKGKGKSSSHPQPVSVQQLSKDLDNNLAPDHDIVNIETTYKGEQLVQIKFDKNKEIPQQLLKIIRLIIKFHLSLEKLVINEGLSSNIVHEISKILPISNITEIILDNCLIHEANYHILLDQPCALKHLSLARCSIGDRGLELICKKLIYPLPASTTLTILNIPTNGITNIGAGYIAKFLRSNRQLKYLNLADNRLSDYGIHKILLTLTQFALTQEEIEASKLRYMNHLKMKHELVNQLFNSMLESGENDKKSYRKKSAKSHSVYDKKKTADQELQSYILERAESAAVDSLGEFKDPFSRSNIVTKDGNLYAKGNCNLTYLNMAYNNLSVITVTELLKVIKYQKSIILPYYLENSGIINVCLEGNPIPKSCLEMTELENVVDKCLEIASKRQSRINKSAKTSGKVQ